MASTYLALCNKVLNRFNEVNLTSSTFSTARDFHAFIKDAVNDAIQDIINAEIEWPFQVQTGSQTLVAGTREYTLPSGFDTIDWESFYLDHVSTTLTAQKLQYINYDTYKANLLPDDLEKEATGSSTYGKPMWVYRTLDGKFGVSTVPDAAYVVKFVYWVTNSALSAYTDQSIIPAQYENVIVDRATYYGYMFREDATQAGILNKRFVDGILRMRAKLTNFKQDMETGQVDRRKISSTDTWF
jgi:hypothetical protein